MVEKMSTRGKDGMDQVVDKDGVISYMFRGFPNVAPNRHETRYMRLLKATINSMAEESDSTDVESALDDESFYTSMCEAEPVSEGNDQEAPCAGPSGIQEDAGYAGPSGNKAETVCADPSGLHSREEAKLDYEPLVLMVTPIQNLTRVLADSGVFMVKIPKDSYIEHVHRMAARSDVCFLAGNVNFKKIKQGATFQ